MDQPRQRLAPPSALVTPPHSAVEVYPRAAVLTAWVNAVCAGVVDGLAECPALNPRDPFSAALDSPYSAHHPAWTFARMTLGEAVATWPTRASAQCALPVPGDVAGLPADAVAARSAGQALVVPGPDFALVVWPSAAGDVTSVWRATTGMAVARADRDIRHARQLVMERLTEAVASFEASGPVRSSREHVARRISALDAVPMPPESHPAAVSLARLSAQLLVIVDAALQPHAPNTLPTHDNPTNPTNPHDSTTRALAPLGRVGRAALATAFSATHPPRSA